MHVGAKHEEARRQYKTSKRVSALQLDNTQPNWCGSRS